ncbi:MAG: RNA 2',3'-cyclic phosphodiesterase [Alphaproteobacteria bacterium]|jgi:2'-5' RNA ligase|nr:RNA 2',3'-cyclic phosphodiesterase [Alphaproteobacteria bacterium]
MHRLFVALDLPRYHKDAIEAIQRGLPDVRWTDPDTLHVTLAFIGEVDNGVFKDAMEALSHVHTRPFALELQGLGHFPPRGPIRQLWVGVKLEPELARLQRRVVRALAEVGVKLDKRKFIPHVTVARFRAPPPEHRLQAYLQRHNLIKLPPTTVSDFHLYSSWLSSGGPHYEIEASYELVPGVAEYHERGDEPSV